MKWCLHKSGFSEMLNFVFCFFKNPFPWKCISSPNYRRSKVVGYCCSNCKNVPAEVMSLLHVSCSEHLYHTHHMMVCVILLILSDWEHLVTDFLGLWSSASSTWATLSCLCDNLCLPPTPVFLLQTLPVNSDFYTRQLIANVVGAWCLLNFLWNCLCTVTKLLVR
jgi:hypothetical protein